MVRNGKAEGKGKANEATVEKESKKMSTKAKKMLLKQSLAFLRNRDSDAKVVKGGGR